MCGIKIPQQDFALKMPGGLMHEGGVFAGHYGTCTLACSTSTCRITLHERHYTRCYTRCSDG